MSPRGIIPNSILAALLVLMTACTSTTNSAVTLRLSMIPTTNPGKIIRESKPFIDYLEKETGTKVELAVPTNYAAVVEAMASDRVDIAYLGGFTYVQVSARAGAKPLVQRQEDQTFHSLFITQPDSAIRSLGDLKGHSFAFGDVNSTSGHLMPAYFMRQRGVDQAVINTPIFTGGLHVTALRARNRKTDAEVMDEDAYDRLTKVVTLSETEV